MRIVFAVYNDEHKIMRLFTNQKAADDYAVLLKKRSRDYYYYTNEIAVYEKAEGQ